MLKLKSIKKDVKEKYRLAVYWWSNLLIFIFIFCITLQYVLHKLPVKVCIMCHIKAEEWFEVLVLVVPAGTVCRSAVASLPEVCVAFTRREELCHWPLLRQTGALILKSALGWHSCLCDSGCSHGWALPVSILAVTLISSGCQWLHAAAVCAVILMLAERCTDCAIKVPQVWTRTSGWIHSTKN